MAPPTRPTTTIRIQPTTTRQKPTTRQPQTTTSANSSSATSYSLCDLFSRFLSPTAASHRTIRPRLFSSPTSLPLSTAQRRQWLCFLLQKTQEQTQQEEPTTETTLRLPDATPVGVAQPSGNSLFLCSPPLANNNAKTTTTRSSYPTTTTTTASVWYPPPLHQPSNVSTVPFYCPSQPSCPSTPSSLQAPEPPTFCLWNCSTTTVTSDCHHHHHISPHLLMNHSRGTSCPLASPADNNDQEEQEKEEEEGRCRRRGLPAATAAAFHVPLQSPPRWTPAELLVDGLLGGRGHDEVNNNWANEEDVDVLVASHRRCCRGENSDMLLWAARRQQSDIQSTVFEDTQFSPSPPLDFKHFPSAPLAAPAVLSIDRPPS
eukprot:GHVS01028035.1.p1 GENE.GHVS01028035.1~~GHVS01028035.1.p1  ORF type:complete len:413 (+),score=118.74 GHVS01028035.1:122-1240(+)